MTNYEYLQAMIDNQAAVENFFCRMIQEQVGEDNYCCYDCPLDEKCRRGRSGIKVYLDEEHKTPMVDWGKYDKKE